MTTATVTKTTRGFKTRCPFCGCEDTLRICVEDVETMTCSDCESDVTADDLREVIGQYTRLLAWLDTAPTIEG